MGFWGLLNHTAQGPTAGSEAANLLTVTRRLVGPSDGDATHMRRLASSRPSCPKELLEKLRGRRRAALDALARSGHHVEKTVVRSLWNVVVGGASSASELRLALHPPYGVPVLPASALKGATRARSEQPERYGSPGKQARALVLDALPASPVQLEQDVVSPHFAPYRQDPVTNPPGEFWNPIPWTFLVVPPDTKFELTVLAASDEDARAVLSEVVAALESGGVGGKASAGYGYFSRVSEERA